jgi:hypothetical protein
MPLAPPSSVGKIRKLSKSLLILLLRRRPPGWFAAYRRTTEFGYLVPGYRCGAAGDSAGAAVGDVPEDGACSLEYGVGPAAGGAFSSILSCGEGAMACLSSLGAEEVGDGVSLRSQPSSRNGRISVTALMVLVLMVGYSLLVVENQGQPIDRHGFRLDSIVGSAVAAPSSRK